MSIETHPSSTTGTHIIVQKTGQSRLNTFDFKTAEFGKHFSDHMLVAEFTNGAWQPAVIKAYGNISVPPSLTVFHHAQAIFEGMKAFKGKDGKINLFRLEDNFRRMNLSAERMCMPLIPKEYFVEGLKQLLDIDRDWVPDEDGFSLYIRPFYISTDTAIGVRPSNDYAFFIITAPAGNYYKEPLKVWIETHFSRSANGGTGYAKAAGNYGGAMYPSSLAMKKGYHQLIWTDAKENRWIEESGSMNIFFIIDDILTTPPLGPSKLAGVTRDSILKIAQRMGVKTEEREISVDEIKAFYNSGRISDCFGCGTAAGIAPIITIGSEDLIMDLPPVESRMVSKRINEYLSRYKKGLEEDVFNWLTTI
jgi:branched-chain amino acid aminotransferase